MSNKKSQVWSLDIIIAVIIFLIGLIGVYIYAVNLSYGSEEKLNLMRNEAELISSAVLSEGYPAEWNTNDVETPGILNTDRIDQEKLERLYSLSSTPENYQALRKKVHTSYDFYIQFNRNVSVASANVSGFGKPGVSFNQNSSNYVSNIENVTDIIRTTRFSIYRNKPIRIDFYVW